MQDQLDDRELAGLARSRPVAVRPAASADQTILGPVPAPLDCPYLLFDDDGPGCLALAPAIRLSRRQVELVCAGSAHVSCPRLIRADSGRGPAPTEPPPAVVRRRSRPASVAAANPVADDGPTEASPGAIAAFAAEPESPPTAEPSMVAAADGAEIAAADVVAADLAGVAAPDVAVAAPGTGGSEVVEIDAAPMSPNPPRPAGSSGPPDADLAGAHPATAHLASDRPAPAAPSTRTRTQDGPPRSSRTRPGARPGATSGRATVAMASARLAARTHLVVRPATAVAWLILLATLVIVIALLASRGGLSLPVAATATPVAGSSPSAVAASPTLAPSPTASPSSTPSVASASPSAGTPTPSPTASPPFPPDRLAVLTACPGVPDCYQYRIKPNDNLRTLAKFFGVEYPALLAANPQITNPSVIHVGDRITIPIPTPAPSPTKTPKP